MSDHKSIKPRLNDICELLGVDLGYRPEKITIHVYQGANEAGHQWNSFHRATSTLDIDKVVIVYCNIKMVKDNRWNPKDLIDWLLDCDVHFIITYPSRIRATMLEYGRLISPSSAIVSSLWISEWAAPCMSNLDSK
jgi:hypothetical protein